MSYEVFIDVTHHPRHNEDWAAKEATAFKLADGEPLELVAAALREFADDLDPRMVCEDCGETRAEHQRVGNLYHCYHNIYGPYGKFKAPELVA